MESNLHAKMDEFMTSLDQITKYKEIAFGMTDFGMGLCFSAVAVIGFYILKGISGLLWANFTMNFYSSFENLIVTIIVAGGVIYGIYKVNNRVLQLPEGQWRPILNEGLPGAIKLLQDQKWEKIFSDIRYAKIGFVIYGLTKVILYWIVASFGMIFLSGAIRSVIHIHTEPLGIILTFLALVLVLYLDRKELSSRYAQIGNFDLLLWELRWLDNEFRRADFKT